MKKLNLAITAALLCFGFATNAQAGCCAGHGGVVSCDKSGYKVCGDKSISKTCKCTYDKKAKKTDKKIDKKADKKASKKVLSEPTATDTPEQVTKPVQKKSSWWNLGGSSKTDKAKTSKPSKATRTVSGSEGSRGCCSHHGGIKGCNTSTGKQICKDGQPSGCPCH